LNEALKWAKENEDWIIDLRRTFHTYPELTGKEISTNKRIREYLLKLSIDFLAPEDNITIARITSDEKSGFHAAIRADTDALPIDEGTSISYSSKNPGVMHACGHDAHIAMGLAAARFFKENPHTFKGTVSIIFQPAEEGGGGAQEVIDTGTIDSVTSFFGIHVWPDLPLGTISVRSGPNCASTDDFEVKIKGRSGHAAHPDKGVDPIPVAAQIISAFQNIVTRRVSPLDSCIISVCNMHSGNSWNIIADSAYMQGTIRAFSDDVRNTIVEHMDKIVSNYCDVYGCKGELIVNAITPAVINDDALTKIGEEAVFVSAGDEALRAITPAMIGDDFALYKNIAPICYAFLGVSSDDYGNVPLHNEKFTMDERALAIGVSWLVNCVILSANKH